MKLRSHSLAMVALVALVAVFSLINPRGRELVVRGGDTIISPLSVTKVDNLVATGTIDSTGEVIARAGVRLTAPTTGPIFKSGTGSPSGAVTATVGSIFVRTDSAEVYQNTDGATAWTKISTTTGTVTSITFSGGLTSSPNPVVGVGTASLADIAQSTIMGRAVAAGTGTPTALTGTQATAILDLATTSVKGLAPVLPNDATKFLNGTGAYSVPAGGVTSITCSTGLSCTASNPITSTGTITANLAGASCSAGSFVSAISSTGTGTCTAVPVATFSGAQVYRNSGLTVATGAGRTNFVQATVAYDTSSYRHGGGGIEDAKLYAPTTGYYLLTAYLEWTGCSTAAGIQGIYFNLNGGGDVGLCERTVNSTNDAVQVCTATAHLTAGDFIIEQISQTTTNNCTANTQSRSPFSMSRLGA